MLTLFVERGRDTPLDGRRDSMTMGTTTESIPASVFDGFLPALPPAQGKEPTGTRGAIAVGVDPWSTLTRREGFGLVCRLVALVNCSEDGRYGSTVCMCRERQISRALYWWDVGCGRADVVEGAGQGRAGQGLAWHGRGRKDRLWS